MMRDISPKPLILAATILPAIVGWASLLAPDPLAIGSLLLAVCAMGAWDNFHAHNKSALQSYAKVRTIMTLASAFTHVAVLLSVL